MTYKISLVHENNKASLTHMCNDFDQAEHFFWAMVTRNKETLGNFSLTLTSSDKILIKFDKTY